MHRRDLLRALSGAAAIPAFAGLSPGRLLDLGAGLHARAAGQADLARGLDASQLEMVAVLAEAIIPETDTPGARAAGVPAFVNLLLAEWYSDADRMRLVKGLAAIDALARERGAAGFAVLPARERTALLAELDARRHSPEAAEWAFGTIKRLTVYGYFTSKAVMRDVMPAKFWFTSFEGCAPL